MSEQKSRQKGLRVFKFGAFSGRVYGSEGVKKKKKEKKAHQHHITDTACHQYMHCACAAVLKQSRRGKNASFIAVPELLPG